MLTPSPSHGTLLTIPEFEILENTLYLLYRDMSGHSKTVMGIVLLAKN